MSAVSIRDNNDYIESLKNLVNLQFQYAVRRSGTVFAEHISGLVKENIVLAGEVKKILGDEFVHVTADDITEEKEQFQMQCRQAQKAGVPLYLEYLLDVFDVNEFERHAIRLLFAFELEKSYGTVAALLQDGWENGYVTPYLVRITYEKEVAAAQLYETFSEGNLLERFFLNIGTADKIRLLKKAELRKRILDFAMGNVLVYWEYSPYLKKWNSDKPLAPWLGKKDRCLTMLEEMMEEKENREAQLIYIYGEEGSGKKFSIQKACEKVERSCFFIDFDYCQRVMQSMDGREETRLIDELVREILIFQSVPVVELSAKEKEKIQSILADGGNLLRRLTEFFPMTFLCAEEKIHMEEHFSVTYLFMEPMSLLEGKEFWETEGKKYNLEDGVSIGNMANKFQLTRGKIKRILENAEKKRQQRNEKVISSELITGECYEVIEQNMGNKAIKVPAVYHMDDLILPPKQKQQLADACNQVKYKHKVYEEWGFQKKISYGKGVSMAFIGPPGTGKTMAAQVIARELGMELYKVELSGVVSKYVGETEKNLDEIFEQAKKSQVILFFDEADALFSKRSEGKETTDKYSNMEAAFLLQKMEAYDGITVLATNLFHHFDEAFKRRLKIIVEFSMPNENDRKRLWQAMIPDKMRIGEIDFDYLARQFELSGSNIRNILLHSAFLAAAKDKPVDMEEIIPAIKNEYAKNGKILLKEDVSEYYMFL